MSEQRVLCYGDLLCFELPQAAGLDDCPFGGYLGFESDKSASLRMIANGAETRSKIEISPRGKDSHSSTIPTNFFANCIFQVEASSGYEAPGQPVNYGNSIKLISHRTGESEYLTCFERPNNILDLVPKSLLVENEKQCKFKIKPKYNIRSDGDRVLYHDLIILTDLYNRELFCYRADKIVFSANNLETSSFRIIPFAIDDKVTSVKGGDIIQLFHKEESVHLTANLFHSNPLASFPELNEVLKVDASEGDTPNHLDAIGFWRVENVINDKTNMKKPIGMVVYSTAVRLKHFLYDQYLHLRVGLVESGDILDLVSEPDDYTEFEFHVLQSATDDDDISPTTAVAINTSMRLFNRKTERYIVVEIGENLKKEFGTSGVDFDKDVFQISNMTSKSTLTGATDVAAVHYPCISDPVERVLVGKQLKLAIRMTITVLTHENVSKGEKLSKMKIAIALLEAHTSDGFLSDFDPDGDGPMTSLFKFCQNVAMQIEYVPILLWIANVAFLRSKDGKLELLPLEDNLAAAAYNMLGRLLMQKNRTVAAALISHAGVSQMLRHLTRARSKKLKSDWKPPLLALVEAGSYSSSAGSAPNHQPIKVITQENIKFLFDRVHLMLAQGKVPDRFAYNFLSKICCPNGVSSFDTTGGGDNGVNKDAQEMVCEQLLGLPDDTDDPDNHPFWSIMVYRTYLDLNPSGDHADGSPRAAMNPDAATGQSSAPERQLLISSTPFGQYRPSKEFGTYLPIRQPDSTAELADDEWVDAIRLRNRQSLLIVDVQDLKYNLAMYRNIDAFQKAAYTTAIKGTMEATVWKPLEELTKAQIEFYCASLDLIAAICCGRNMWTQRVVRKLLPVDHILCALDDITDDPSKSASVIAVRSSLISVLYHCYIDSAMLAPMPINGRDKQMKTVDANLLLSSVSSDDKPASSKPAQSKQAGSPSDTWDNLFVDECYGKIFSLVSQEEDYLIDVSENMSVEDIDGCLKFLSHSAVYRKLNDITFGSSSNFDANLENLLKVPVVTMTPTLLDFMMFQRSQQRLNLAKRNSHSLKQRARLYDIIMRFVRYQAVALWDDEIEGAVMQYTGNVHDNDKSMFFFRGEPVDMLDHAHAAQAAAVTPRSSSHSPHHEVSVNMRGKSRPSKSNIIRGADESLFPERKAILAIREKIAYVLNMLVLIRGTLLRRFYEAEYNQIPLCSNSEATPGENAASAVPFYNIEPSNDFHIAVKTNIGGSIVRFLTGRRSSAKVAPAHTTGAAASSHNANAHVSSHVDDSDFPAIREIIFCLVNILSCLPGIEIDESLFASEIGDKENIEKYFRRHFGYVVDHFGIIAGMIDVKLACVRVLIICLELMHSKTSQTLWSVFVVIYEEFKQQKMAKDRESEEEYKAKLTMAHHEETKANGGVHIVAAEEIARHIVENGMHFQERKKMFNLNGREKIDFRRKTNDILLHRLKNDPDLIWNTTELFSHTPHEAILRLVFFNNNFLRAEALNLLYRANSTRSELATILNNEFQENRVEDNLLIHYAARQKIVLQQVLCRFRVAAIQSEHEKMADLSLEVQFSSSTTTATAAASTKKLKSPPKGGTSRKQSSFEMYNTTRKPSKSSFKHKVSSEEMKSVARTTNIFKLKHVLLNSDVTAALGIINFCFDDRDMSKVLNPISAVQETVTDTDHIELETAEDHKLLPRDKNGNESHNPHINPKKLMLKMAARLRQETALGGDSEIVPVALQINNTSTSFEIMRMPPCKLNQKIIAESDIHDVIIEFLVVNHRILVDNIEKCQVMIDEKIGDDLDSDEDEAQRQARISEAKASKELAGLLACQEQHLEVFRYCFIFLRAFVCQNKENATLIGNTTLVAILLYMRHCCDEALNLLTDLIMYNPNILSLITDSEFVVLVKDIQSIIYNIYDSSSSSKPSQLGLSVKRCKASLALIQTIISSSNNGGRMHVFLHLIGHRDELGVSLIEKSIFVGLGAPTGRPTVAEGDESRLAKSKIVLSGYQDCKYMCRLYHTETERVAFSRLPDHVLADPKVTDALFVKLKDMLSKWKPLDEDSSVLYLHLNIISVLGQCAKKDIEMQHFCYHSLANPKFILQILMIDKYEIRKAYLQLLHGTWFNDQEYYLEFISPEYHDDMLALFFSFSQDLRLYHRLSQLKQSDPSYANEYFRKNVALLESYLMEAVLPFVHEVLSTSFMHEFDDFEVADDDPNSTHAGETFVESKSSKSSGSCIVEHLQDILVALSKLCLSNYYSHIWTSRQIIHVIRELLAKKEFVNAHAARSTRVKTLSRSDLNVIKSAMAALDRKQTELNMSKNAFELSDLLKCEIIKTNCISEFIPVVDEFSLTNGYDLPDLKSVKPQKRVCEQGEILDQSAFKDEYADYIYDRVPLILDPLNSRAFRYSVDEFSRIMLAFCQRECDDFPRIVQRMLSLQAESGEFFDEFLSSVDPAFLSSRKSALNALKSIGSDLTSIVQTTTTVVATAAERSMLASGGRLVPLRERRTLKKLQPIRGYKAFMKWSKSGGMFFEKIFEHFQFCLSMFQVDTGFKSCSFSADDICRTNSYWSSAFTEGLLRSQLAEMYEQFADQSATELDILKIEQDRLYLLQIAYRDLTAMLFVVRQVSVPVEKLKKTITSESIDILHNMAVSLGISLLENGNLEMQNYLVSIVEDEFYVNVTHSSNKHFLSAIRILIQSYVDKLTSDGLTDISAKHVSRIVRLLSLWCEGHNNSCQLFLYRYAVVTEVATFAVEINNMLETEMVKLMDNFMHCPVISGVRRFPIQWISDGDQTNVKVAAELSRMKMLASIAFGIFEALSEFSQGPCYENQLAISRAGPTRQLGTFFSFFGSLQMCTKSKPISASHSEWYQNYKNSIGKYVTHENVLELMPSEGSPVWYGNDAISVYLLKSFMENKESYAVDDDNFMNKFKSLGDNKLFSFVGSVVQTKELSVITKFSQSILRKTKSLTQRSAETFATAALSLLTDDARIGPEVASEFTRGTIDEWIQQKKEYMDSVRAGAPMPAGNGYSRIADFCSVAADLETACLKFCSSLLEGSKMDEDAEVPRNITKSVHVDNLMANMSNYWNRYLKYEPVDDIIEVEDCYERKLSYAYYALVMRICDLNDKLKESVQESAIASAVMLPETVETWIRQEKIPMEEHIARVELRGNDSAVSIVYFPIPTLIKKYWDRGDIVDLRENIVFPTDQSKRDSAEEKVKSFLKDGRSLIVTLRHFEKLDEVYAVRNIFFRLMVYIANNFNRWGTITFILSVTMNILLIRNIFDNDRRQTGVYGRSYYILASQQVVIDRLALAQLISALVTAASYSIMYGWLHINQGLADNPHNEFIITGYTPTRIAVLLNRFGLFGTESDLKGNVFKVKLWQSTMICYYYFNDPGTVYYVCLLTFSFLGVFFNPLYFSLCLVELLRMSKLMQYVSKAFISNIDQVIAAVGLAVIILYLFTVLSYATPELHGKYNLNGMGENQPCSSLSGCFRFHLDFGVLQSVLWDAANHIETPGGEIFNFAFAFTLQIVIPGLVSGIIIDTFSEMRSSKMAIDEDVNNTCFICNIDREDFETASIDFTDHIKNDHNMWKYLWYMIYLEKKDRTEFDGIEQYCFSIITGEDKNNIKWLPVKVAKALSRMRDKYDLYSIFQKVTALHYSQEKLESNLRLALSMQERALKEVIKSEAHDTINSVHDEVTVLKKSIQKMKDVRRGTGADFRSPVGAAAMVAAAPVAASKPQESSTSEDDPNPQAAVDPFLAAAAALRFKR